MEPDAYVSKETAPMEMPWRVRVFLRTWQWLLVNKNGELNRRMEKLFDFRVPAVARDGVVAKDVIIDPGTGVWVRIFRPDPHKFSLLLQLPVFFYFHGGGFTMLSANSTFPDSFCRYLCKTFQAVVVSVDYRKTPQYQYPTAYDDCYAAVQWVADQSAASLLAEADLSKCFLVGESAGGNIVHHVTCRIASDAAGLGRRLTVLGNLVLSPFFGGKERTQAELRLLNVDPILNYVISDWAWQAFLPPGADRDHPAANIAGPEAPDLTGVPLAPFLVTVGDYDSLKDWQVLYAQALQGMGQEVELRVYKGGVHCFHGLPQLAVAALFRADFEHFVRSKLR